MGKYILVQQYMFQYWWILISVALWTLPWKGVALWKSARANHSAWFVILLLVNTLAILEIVYIFFFSKKNHAEHHHV